MGRPDRIFFVITHLRIQSPIIWDVIIISTYLVISILLLYISLLPDIALCRDRLTEIPNWKKKLYRITAINWHNHPKQIAMLRKVNKILAIAVLPVAFAFREPEQPCGASAGRARRQAIVYLLAVRHHLPPGLGQHQPWSLFCFRGIYGRGSRNHYCYVFC